MISEKGWLGEHFPGRLGIQQRVIPSYRINFFDLLASACRGGLNIIAGSSLPEESITIIPGSKSPLFQSTISILSVMANRIIGLVEKMGS